jgi:hypothetical protein
MTGVEALQTRPEGALDPDMPGVGAPFEYDPLAGRQEAGETERRRSLMFAHPWVRRLAIGASALAMSGGFTEGAATAFATGEAGPPAGNMVSSTTTTTIRTSEGAADARDVAKKKMYILEDVRLRGKVHMDQCHWTKGGFINSGRDANGKIRYYFDPKRAKLCRDSASPTGFVKVAGGTTGRNCRNVATDHKKAPGPLLKGKVEILRNLNVRVKLRSVAAVAVRESCGTATAKASVYQRINLKSFLRKTGNGQVHSILHLQDRAVTKATAHVKCNETDTTTTTTTTTPTPTPTPTPGPNKQPPSVSLNQKTPAYEGAFVNDQQEFCADAHSNPLSLGIRSVIFKAVYGKAGPTFMDQGEFCSEIQFGSTPVTDERVTATATDNNGLTAEDNSGAFPVRQEP